MLNYKVFYRMQMGSFQAEVPDFPEATAFGMTVAEARANVFSALRYAAEKRIRRGELLPMPDPARTAADAYLVETVVVLPQGAEGVSVQPGR
jgi:predicted RNase H-like HicB family nuclease